MAKIGLVLEGGGMRGVYTTGVLDAFLDQNIEFDGTIGVSAGSCHGASFLSKQRERGFRVTVDYLKDWRYCSFRSLLVTGDIFGVKMLYDTIPNKLDPYDHEAFGKKKGWFRSVLTNVETGKPEYPILKEMHKDIIYLQASSSLPMLSKLVKIEDKHYLDGGITDSIPVQKAFEFGMDKVVVILTQPIDYRKEPNKLMPLIKVIYRKYPNLIRSLNDRHLGYNQTLELIEELKSQEKLFVIQPQNKINIGRLEKDKEKLTEVYYWGYKDGQEKIEKLKEFMGN